MPRDLDPDVRKIVALDTETWHALVLLGRERDRTFQELADEAFNDLLKKHRRPVTLRESLKQSVGNLRNTEGHKKASRAGAERPRRPGVPRRAR